MLYQYLQYFLVIHYIFLGLLFIFLIALKSHNKYCPQLIKAQILGLYINISALLIFFYALQKILSI